MTNKNYSADFPPKEIKFKTDGNVIIFQNTIRPGTEVMYLYKYKKSVTKKDQLLGLTKPELEKMIKTNA